MENSRIVLKDSAGVGLEKVASQFKSDMKEITGMELEVVSGEGGDEDDILIEVIAGRYIRHRRGRIFTESRRRRNSYQQ